MLLYVYVCNSSVCANSNCQVSVAKNSPRLLRLCQAEASNLPLGSIDAFFIRFPRGELRAAVALDERALAFQILRDEQKGTAFQLYPGDVR